MNIIRPSHMLFHLSVLTGFFCYRWKWGWEPPDPDWISPQIILNAPYHYPRWQSNKSRRRAIAGRWTLTVFLLKVEIVLILVASSWRPLVTPRMWGGSSFFTSRWVWQDLARSETCGVKVTKFHNPAWGAAHLRNDVWCVQELCGGCICQLDPLTVPPSSLLQPLNLSQCALSSCHGPRDAWKVTVGLFPAWFPPPAVGG